MKKHQLIFSTAAGHIIEYFDSYLYGYLAFMLAPIFFPSNNPTASLIASFGAFAAGFLMRPIGGLFFGHIGDRYGRKIAFLSSIALMSLPTFGIGCLPSYESVGIIAPILLIIFRLIQGVSLGGEYGGAAIFIREHVKSAGAGFAGSLLATIGFIGALGGTLIGAIFTQGSFPSWSWRIPFFIGGVFGVFIYFLRQRLEETPSFMHLENTGNILKQPLSDIFRHHFTSFISGIGIGAHTTVPYYLSVIYMNTQYQERFFLGTSQVLGLSSVLMLLLIISIPIAGFVSDKVGRTKLMSWSALSTLLLAFPTFYIMQEASHFALFFLCQVLICLTSAPYMATCSSVLPMLFPPEARYTGTALSYSLGVAALGGTSPLLVTWLQSNGFSFVPAFYLILSGLIGYFAIFSIKGHEYEHYDFPPVAPKELAA